MKQTAVQPDCLQQWHWKFLRIPALLGLTGISAIPWGDQIFRTTHALLRELPLSPLFDASVQFAGMAFLLIVAALIYTLDKSRARLLVYLVVSLATVGLINSTIKQLAGRSRPEWSVSLSKAKRQELQSYNTTNPATPVPTSKADHWFGPTSNRPYFMDRYASFPSGHSASVFALAAFLCILYPKARSIWLACAVSCALSRVYGERHYLEDVMVGGSLGWIVAHWVFTWQWPLNLTRRRFKNRISEIRFADPLRSITTRLSFNKCSMPTTSLELPDKYLPPNKSATR